MAGVSTEKETKKKGAGKKARRKAASKAKYSPSRMLRRMEKIERLIDDIRESEKISERVDRRMTAAQKRMEKTGKEILEQEKDIEGMGKEILEKEREIETAERDIIDKEKDIKEALIKIAIFTFRRERVLELARGVAGAFLGVAIGFSLMSSPELAVGLAWTNAIGILAFIIAISAVLVYKGKKEWIEKEGAAFIVKRLVALYVICICIEVIALVLFGMFTLEAEPLAKALIIGSYPAMAGAVAFSIA
jgi:uncharacterized membrane protein